MRLPFRINKFECQDTLLGGSGDDTLQDFTAGAATDDVIQLSLGVAFDTFAEVQAAATQVGGDTVIDFGAGDSLTLVGVTATDLNAADFLFV